MAKDKKTFVLYVDQRTYFDKLSNEDAGKLIKHIFSYVSDENPTPDNIITDLSFEPIKLQLKRDLKKYEAILEKRSKAGKLSAEKRKQESTKATSVESVEHNSTNPTDNDNDNDNDIKNNIHVPPKGGESFNFPKFLETINQTFNRNFKVINQNTQAKIKARLKDGYTKQDIMDAISNCQKAEFHKNNGFQYCTPEYFSRADILDKWSDVKEVKKQKIQL